MVGCRAWFPSPCLFERFLRTPQPHQSFRSLRPCVVGFLRSRVAARTLHILGSQPDPPSHNQALFKCSDLYQSLFWPLRRTDSRKGQLSGFQFKLSSNLWLSNLPGFVPECAPPNRGQPQFLGQPHGPYVCHSAQKLGLSLTGQQGRTLRLLFFRFTTRA